MPSVFFLKNKTTPRDPYSECFQESGFSIDFIPLLDHLHTEVPCMMSYLSSSEFMDDTPAFIITSQRAVEALGIALQGLPTEVRQAIFKKTSFTVGPATSKILSELGFVNIKGGSDAGNGSILADIIINELSIDTKITFFTGETRRDIIPNRLGSKGYDLTEFVLYKTNLKDNIIERFTQQFKNAQSLNSRDANWVIFFSPQGTLEIVNYLKSLHDGQHHSRSTFRIASIGPTTESYLIEKGLPPDLVSSKPEAITLLRDIQNYYA